MTRPITAAMVGAGGRGTFAYGPYALEHPDEIQFVAVAEPDLARRQRFADLHNIPPSRQYTTWEDLLNEGKMADALFNMTQDQMHYESTLGALDVGYDILLEKPMTARLDESVHLVQAAEQQGRLLLVCHVLRYTPFFSTLHDIVASGRLGDIVTVEHRENVVYWHMAHSFVRGHWRNEAESSPMILAKCCHDLDILYWNMGRPAQQLHSFGSLMHFRPENAPPGATRRCTDGCPAAEECPFDARPIYLNLNNTGWPVRAITEDLSMEARLHALKTGPYGRCVYDCDNDVVDHQVVNMAFEGGAVVTLVMHGHSHEEGRTMRYDGTCATLRGKSGSSGSRIEIHDHLTGRCVEVPVPESMSGHGGGDHGIMRGFVRVMRGDEAALTTARESLESHLLAWAAEESRHEGSVVNMNDFRRRAEEMVRG